MKRIKEEVDKIINNSEMMISLLILEKERRVLDEKELLFVGMSNFCSSFWCANQAVLKSKETEIAYFSSYFQDRLDYSYRLGYINKLPENKNQLLEIGDEIEFCDIEKLLKEEAEKLENDNSIQAAILFKNEKGFSSIVINPDISKEQKDIIEKDAQSKGILIADLEEYPILRGNLLHETRAKRLPQIRWNFNWGKYIMVGVPDGITEEFVYEFKTVKNRNLLEPRKPSAFAQGDLYGIFFKRTLKKIHFHIVNEKNDEIWQEKVNRQNVLELYRTFLKVDTGWIPPRVEEWKCRSCKYIQNCKSRKYTFKKKK